MRKIKFRSLRGKIMLTMIAVVALTVICLSVLFVFNSKTVTDTLIRSNKQMTQTSRSRSSSTMTELNQTRLLELANGKAELADRMFYEFEEAVYNVATAAQILYENADFFPEREVPVPDKANDGKLAVQVLYGEGTDPEDEAVRKEMLLLGNLQEMLYSINLNDPSIVSNYIATATGITVQADYISGMKFDEDGNVAVLELRERPWYQGAAVTRSLYLTAVVADLHTGRPTVMCGVPVYANGVLKAVAGAGMYLDSVESIIRDMDLGGTGYACVVNQYGQVLFSSDQNEETALFHPGQDLLSSGDPAMRMLASKATHSETGVMLLELGRTNRYVAYAPMETTGWSVFVILPRSEVDAPTTALLRDLEKISEESASEADKAIQGSTILMTLVFAGALLAALAASVLLSRRIVTPIRTLTEKVREVEGDNLDFHWDPGTGDETQLLADSFESLTERMKSYISDIQTITAEKERIGTELSLATRIQSGMLPNSFPAFPDRSDFDIYASMDPAKEVGGDFYDFQLLDEDHLAMVIADVSDKGIPAALFMMISMILIRTYLINGSSPAEALEKVNAQISARNKEDMFVTVWLGILDLKTGVLTASNAGHEYPALKMADGRFEMMKDKHGFVIGTMPDMIYTEYQWKLEPGSKVFVYTDGLPDAVNPETEQFGKDRIIETLRGAENGSPQEILTAMDRAVDEFSQGAAQFDDLTMLCVEYKGPREEK